MLVALRGKSPQAASNFLASEGLPRILWHPKFHYCLLLCYFRHSELVRLYNVTGERISVYGALME
jgi:hypothetical protein